MRLSSAARSSVIIGLCGFLSVRASAQQLKLGANPSILKQDAILELNSPNQGLLLPRVTRAQIIAGGKLFGADDGMMVYVTDATERSLYIKRNGSWEKVGNVFANGIIGDISASVNGSNALVTSLNNGVVTYAKMQNVADQSILGRYSTTAGTVQELKLGSNLTLNTTTGVITANAGTALWNASQLQGRNIATTVPADGNVLKWNNTTSVWEPGAAASTTTTLTGDVTGTGAGTFGTTIANGVVSFAKMQNIATQRLLGRYTTGAGSAQEVSLGSNLLLNTSGVLSADAATALWNANQLSGRSITTTAPASGEVLKWNGTAWAPAADATGSGVTSLTGDVTGTGPGATATTIANQAVTFAKMQNIATQRLLGRYTTGTGATQEVTLGTNLALTTAGVLNASGITSLTGDVTAATTTGAAATTIANKAVTYAKMQDAGGSRLLGRAATTTGAVGEISVGTGLELTTAGVLNARADDAIWNANRIQGRTLATTAPTNGQVMKFNTTTSLWEPSEDLAGGATYGTLGDNDIGQADAPEAFSRMKIWASNGTGTVANGPLGTSAYSWNVLSFRGPGYTTQLFFDKSTLGIKEWGGNAAALTTNAGNPWYKVVLTHGDMNIANGAVIFGGKTHDASTEIMQDAAMLFWDNANKRLGIGTNAPNSTLEVDGSIAESLTIVNSSTTLNATMSTVVVRRTGSGTANITVTFPLASTCPGRIYTIIKDYTGGVSGNLTFAFTSPDNPGFSKTYGNATGVIRFMSVGTKWARIGYEDNSVF